MKNGSQKLIGCMAAVVSVGLYGSLIMQSLPSPSVPEVYTEAAKAVGFVHYQDKNGKYKNQTGFFIAPNVFVTARNPSEESDNLRCEQTLVYTNMADGKRTSFESASALHCSAIVYSNAPQGVTVFRTKEENSAFIPLSDFTEFSLLSNSYSTAVGYSLEVKLFHSDNCRLNNKVCQICDKRVIDAPVWRELRCLYRSGMVGSPVVKVVSGRVVAFGLVGFYIAKANKNKPENNSELISVVDLNALAKKVETEKWLGR
ncbi:MAG: hypothetical protein HY537_16935 [Deltaproteobacteria bacterium]|nr:hypothetical protein [Deltaproteobacteria bacterium]